MSRHDSTAKVNCMKNPRTARRTRRGQQTRADAKTRFPDPGGELWHNCETYHPEDFSWQGGIY